LDYQKLNQLEILNKSGRNSKHFGNQSNIEIVLPTESKCMRIK